MLWRTLHVLSYYAAREERSDIDFRNYGLCLDRFSHMCRKPCNNTFRVVTKLREFVQHKSDVSSRWSFQDLC